MMREGPLKRAARVIEFGRHIPLSKLARRIELDVRRRLRDRLTVGIPANVPVLVRASVLPCALLFRPSESVGVGEGTLRFTFLGRTETLSRSGLDWQAPGAGPEHQLWRMNLHYMEYLKDLPDSVWGDLVDDWIDANPACCRGAWKDSWNSYALSLRVVEWMQELTRRADRLPSDLVARVEGSLAQQLIFLERNLETDLGGNHLIKNIKALIWASAFFAGPDAARWRSTGVGLLQTELGRQILIDGMHYERSPSYHCQVFADLLECRHALAEDPLGGALDDALYRMAQATADLVHPDGQVALFNDAGLTMAYAPAACLDAYCQLFGRRPTPRPVFALDHAGYYGLRVGGTYLIVDCGRIAPDDLPAHGHSDVLSFEWAVAGERVIVDQGVFEYVPGERRRRSRAAESHNTLCFEGADQADFFGAFRCGRRPNVKVVEYEAKADGFVLEGTHDGFTHLHGAPRHFRRFEVRPGEIVIRDRVEGKPKVAASIGFLLGPGVQIDVSSHQALIRTGASLIRMTSTLPICVEEGVWWPNMGHEERTSRLRIRLGPGVSEASTVFQVARTQ